MRNQTESCVLFTANADRTEKRLVPPVDPDTGAVYKNAGQYVDVAVPGNITFTRCVFADNQVTQGNAGAVWVKVSLFLILVGQSD